MTAAHEQSGFSASAAQASLQIEKDASRYSTQTSSHESLPKVDAMDEVTVADEALIEKGLLWSDGDLQFAKMQLEERIKYALGYDFNY